MTSGPIKVQMGDRGREKLKSQWAKVLLGGPVRKRLVGCLAEGFFE